MFWINLIFSIILFAGICCFIAMFSESVRQAFSSFFAIFYGPFSMIHERTSACIYSVRSWISGQLVDEAESKAEGPLYYVIGAVLYSILTVIFLLCDFGMIALTFEAFGMDKLSVHLPVDTSTLSAATLVTTSLFFGAIFFDLLGITRLAPWRKSLSPRNRRILMAICLLFFIVSLFVAISMAYWRGNITTQLIPDAEASTSDTAFLDQSGLSLAGDNSGTMGGMQADIIAEEDLPPLDDSANWVVYSSLMGIAVLSISATAFSAVGLMKLIKFIIILIAWVLTLPLLLVKFSFWLIADLLNRVFNLVLRIVDFFINVGNAILRCFGRQPVESGNQAVHGNATNDEMPEAADARSDQPETDDGNADPGFNPFSRKQQ